MLEMLSGVQGKRGLEIWEKRPVALAMAEFAETVNTIFREHHLRFEFVNGQIVNFESQALHQNITKPVLSLLGGRPGFDSTETAYTNALRELQDGSPDGAITAASTVLQEVLGALGFEGKDLGTKLRAARKADFFAPYDQRMTVAIDDIIKWVGAERGQQGGVHTVSSATPEDAALAVNVVGALILRLVKGSPRGRP